MEFRFETDYDKKALTEMAKAARKTLRGKRSARTKIFTWIIVVVALALAIWPLFYGAPFSLTTAVTLIVAVLLIVVNLSEDALNAALAKKKLPPGSEKASAIFNEEGIISKTDMGTSKFEYDEIMTLIETKGYFILILSETHAELYDKARISGGTVDQFREFMIEKTERNFHRV